MRNMRFIVIFLLVLLLSGCSSKPELSQILDQALGYAPLKQYALVQHERSPKFLDICQGYNESFLLELDAVDYKNLLEIVNSKWKLQPKKIGGAEKWERIAVVQKYGVTSVSSVRSDSRYVFIHVSQ